MLLTSGQAYDRARECLRVAREHLHVRPVSLSAGVRKIREAQFWRDTARCLRRKEQCRRGGVDVVRGPDGSLIMVRRSPQAIPQGNEAKEK